MLTRDTRQQLDARALAAEDFAIARGDRLLQQRVATVREYLASEGATAEAAIGYVSLLEGLAGLTATAKPVRRTPAGWHKPTSPVPAQGLPALSPEAPSDALASAAPTTRAMAFWQGLDTSHKVALGVLLAVGVYYLWPKKKT